MDQFSIEHLRPRLNDGLAAMGIELDATARERLLALIGLLIKWNKAYNLTAVRDPLEMVPRHLLDSLSLLPDLQGETVLDVGTGAGFPGLPLAIARPETAFTLLDSALKRTRFVRQAALELGLENVEVVQSRIEDYRPARRFDTVTCRAFSSLGAFVEAAGGLVAPGGRLVAMKGRYPQEELADCPPEWRLQSARPVRVPGLDAERHQLILARVQED
ncbi:16S rRNA (guanine(527)-N(7))-methyltransferase RsmG [Natronospira bacteriovora]|uniref:Ribosomal RNA small subunit methyltransferase G n=1 Tax=Natronospira bacteriovora TaxID=3069753 RepID=A0ABU0W8E4_9GAMM|nr:16S rRNA (guanine(527)-N(7))-methyltransferase RsmG [Natronospira sp. AB-CW4]MDQ2069730.1 16S rRNA (guanine(527)-N(7))-methyltransferase RsmG [Natronospira sp. AB-CW4]